MEVYKRQTREIIMRFLLRQLSFQKCIAALDAALAGALPRQKPEQLDELRAVMLANNEKVMEEWPGAGRRSVNLFLGSNLDDPRSEVM